MKFPKLSNELVIDRLTNKGFNLLETYKGAEKKHLLQCNYCHTIKNIHIVAAWSGHTRCKCQSIGKNNSNWAGYEDISKSFWHGIVRNSSRNNLGLKCEFNITIEYLWNLYLIQDRKCIISGETLFFPKSNKEKRNLSLDRIDSTRGYVKGNVQWISSKINIMKWYFSLPYFLNMVKLINTPVVRLPNILGMYGIPKKFCGWKGYNNVSQNTLYTWQKGAKKRNISFDLTAKDIWDMYFQQQGLCAITGLPIFFSLGKHIQLTPKTVSIDRINSELNYTLNNCWLVHKDINLIKYTLSLSELQDLASLVVKKLNL